MMLSFLLHCMHGERKTETKLKRETREGLYGRKYRCPAAKISCARFLSNLSFCMQENSFLTGFFTLHRNRVYIHLVNIFVYYAYSRHRVPSLSFSIRQRNRDIVQFATNFTTSSTRRNATTRRASVWLIFLGNARDGRTIVTPRAIDIMENDEWNVLPMALKTDR